MKYLILVSHGEFASGLHNALEMLAGKREDVISIGLKDGTSADQFFSEVEQIIPKLQSSKEIIVLADIIGGSPLTTTLQVFEKYDLVEKTTIIGGMNLPLALTTVLMKDTLKKEELTNTVLVEAKTALQPFVVIQQEEEEI